VGRQLAVVYFCLFNDVPKKLLGECRSPPCSSMLSAFLVPASVYLRDPRVPPHSDKNKSSDPIPFNLKFLIKNLRLSEQLLCLLDPVNGKKQL